MIDLDVTRKQGNFVVQTAFSGPGSGVTALYGPSGAGKTSVVNMVAGLMRPDNGHITINGHCLFSKVEKINLPPESRRIGYVFQDGRLLPHLSVKSNLMYGLTRTPAKDRFVRPDQIVDLLGIGHLLKRRPAGLSGGEKQRVAIGRALLTSPELLLMDEPLASLDQARKNEVMPFIQRLCHEFSLPVLYVSHSLEEILNLAAYLVLIDNGKVEAAGPIEELLSQPELAPMLPREDFGSVVSTTVSVTRDAYDLTHLTFAGGILKVPGFKVEQGSRVRVRIPAQSVGIALQPPQQSSFQNIFPGTIESISNGSGPFVTLRIDVGHPLLARITLNAKEDLGLHHGQKVYALVKSVNVSHGGNG